MLNKFFKLGVAQKLWGHCPRMTPCGYELARNSALKVFAVGMIYLTCQLAQTEICRNWTKSSHALYKETACFL